LKAFIAASLALAAWAACGGIASSGDLVSDVGADNEAETPWTDVDAIDAAEDEMDVVTVDVAETVKEIPSCGVGISPSATCDQRYSAVWAAETEARRCTTHGECVISGDPTCTSGFWPGSWSLAHDYTKLNCLVDAFFAAGCHGQDCDWFDAYPPGVACLDGACTVLPTNCKADADCGPDQTCLSMGSGFGPFLVTYCALCTADAGTYCTEGCKGIALQVSVDAVDPCALTVVVQALGGTDTVTMDGRKPYTPTTLLPNSGCWLSYRPESAASFEVGCGDCGGTFRKFSCEDTAEVPDPSPDVPAEVSPDADDILETEDLLPTEVIDGGVDACVPDCGSRTCGDDGCGGSCSPPIPQGCGVDLGYQECLDAGGWPLYPQCQQDGGPCICTCPTGDGGCPCTSGSQCQGMCITMTDYPGLPTDAECLPLTLGACSGSTVVLGCMCILDEDGVPRGGCWD
jgi:hypothetical protein